MRKEGEGEEEDEDEEGREGFSLQGRAQPFVSLPSPVRCRSSFLSRCLRVDDLGGFLRERSGGGFDFVLSSDEVVVSSKVVVGVDES